MKVVLKNVRLAFPALFEPASFDEGEGRYGAIFIFEPKSENTKKMRDAIAKAGAEQWKAKATATLAMLKKKDKLALKEEPYANKEGEVYDGFTGMFYVRASNVARPKVKDRTGEINAAGKFELFDLSQEDGRPYAGCFVNATIDVWAQNNKYGQRINAKLLGVQWVKDGESFGAGAHYDDSDFDDLGVDVDDNGDDTEVGDDDADDLA